ncbi:MAG: VOC family protein [Rhizobacter sp.]
MTQRSTAIPCLRYRDAPAAIEWLCRVFGFEQHLLVPDDAGGIAHAQLVLGGGMVMLGSARDNGYGQLVKQPDEVGGAQTQTSYLVVADADIVHARAVAAGARIALALEDEDYGGRGFSCFDLEGHLWSVGTYDPWA